MALRNVESSSTTWMTCDACCICPPPEVECRGGKIVSLRRTTAVLRYTMPNESLMRRIVSVQAPTPVTNNIPRIFIIFKAKRRFGMAVRAPNVKTRLTTTSGFFRGVPSKPPLRMEINRKGRAENKAPSSAGGGEGGRWRNKPVASHTLGARRQNCSLNQLATCPAGPGFMVGRWNAAEANAGVSPTARSTARRRVTDGHSPKAER
jgi:hypothetical protein